MEPKIIVEDKEVTLEEFQQIKESAKNDGKLLKEVSPGVFKILEKLKD